MSTGFFASNTVYAGVVTTPYGDSPAEELLQWITGTNAIISHERIGSHRIMENPTNPVYIAEAVNRVNDRDREELIERVSELLNGHCCNLSFTGIYSAINASMYMFGELGKEFLVHVLTQYADYFGDAVYLREMLSHILDTGNRWEDRGILAWELFRVGINVNAGYIAGVLEREEAYLLMEPAANLLRLRFSSWEEVVDNYLDGYIFWQMLDLQTSFETAYANAQSRRDIFSLIQVADPYLFDNSLFERAPIIYLQRTMFPTKELLRQGHWFIQERENLMVEFYFSDDGTVFNYTLLIDFRLVTKGTYSFTNNGMLTITYSYIDYSGEGFVPFDRTEGNMIQSFYFFSSDGKNLISIDLHNGNVLLWDRTDGIIVGPGGFVEIERVALVPHWRVYAPCGAIGRA